LKIEDSPACPPGTGGRSSPDEKLSVVVVEVAEAVGRWRVVGWRPDFNNSEAGWVGRATTARAVEIDISYVNLDYYRTFKVCVPVV